MAIGTWDLAIFLYTLPMESPTLHGSAPLPFSSMSDDEVQHTLITYKIGLTVEEACKIQSLLGRAPTVVEAVIWGIQGSEHSSYKSSRRFLKAFHTSGKHVILGPKEDSGIVAITDGPVGKRWGLVISHESHNHPSQLVPFEGAATGVGGTVRDVVCMGARVIGAMDMLRLGSLETDETRNIAREVMRGIGGYGNPLGIPNVGGDTVFDASYNSNCLVNAIALGIVREDEIIHSYVPEEAGAVGYDIILVGKPTDRSGFGGASFSSLSLDAEKNEQNTGAVQEPNPFLERHLLASTYALFDWLVANDKLHAVSFKDLGAGGVVCASVEQVAEAGFGADVSLDNVHVSIDNLPAEVIACAETQERFCWTCHPSLTEHILKHYNDDWDLPSVAENARASVIGKVTPDGIYRLRHQGKVVCEARSVDITSGLQYTRPTRLSEVVRTEPQISCDGDAITVQIPHPTDPASTGEILQTTIGNVFKNMLAHPNHASKDPVIRHYDKTVIGNSIIEAGEADAGVLMPLADIQNYLSTESHPGWEPQEKDRHIGAAFAADGNPRYGRISAYWQGANAVIESVSNVAAVGAEPRALTDCLNYGNPEVPEQLAALEEGVRGIAEAAKGVAVNGEPIPVISGNVSLYNSTPDGSAIPPSAIVCCVGVMEDARKAVSMQLKQTDSTVLLIGELRDECGGSAYYEVLEHMASTERDALLGSRLPQAKFADVLQRIEFLHSLMNENAVLACHDISDGGLLLALFEMTLPVRKIGGSIGLNVQLDELPPDLRSDTLLFTQSHGFLVEVPTDAVAGILKKAKGVDVSCIAIATTAPDAHLRVTRCKNTFIDVSVDHLRSIWEKGLVEALGAA